MINLAYSYSWPVNDSSFWEQVNFQLVGFLLS